MKAKKLLANKLVLAAAALLVVVLIADETFAARSRGRGGYVRGRRVSRGGHHGSRTATIEAQRQMIASTDNATTAMPNPALRRRRRGGC